MINKPREDLLKEMEKLGSTEVIPWMKECIDIDEDVFNIESNEVIHLRAQPIDEFKKSIDRYIKDNPSKKVMVSAFIVEL